MLITKYVILCILVKITTISSYTHNTKNLGINQKIRTFYGNIERLYLKHKFKKKKCRTSGFYLFIYFLFIGFAIKKTIPE